jgi:hypothetical protein
MRLIGLGACAAVIALAGVAPAFSQPPAATSLHPNLIGQTDKPLRYTPDHGDFVIRNGAEFFNRSLYGGHTGFRVDGGDKPEFVLYLPGRGGNLRLAIRTASGAKWLHEAAEIETRYRPGELLYAIKDPAFGAGVVKVEALAYAATEGLVVKVEATGLPAGAELVWAYGGVNGQRGTRDGDIGTEKVPISEYFQFKPEFAKDNAFATTANGFSLKSTPASISGVVSSGGDVHVADANQWNDLAALTAGASPEAVNKVVVGRTAITAGKPVYISLQRTGRSEAEELAVYRAVRTDRAPAGNQPNAPLDAAYAPADLAKRFDVARTYFGKLRAQVKVETPDPFIDAAVGALNVGADAVWDDRQSAVMHGAIAWRSKLLGWRGPYAMDALGWHDRMRRNIKTWMPQQNTDPIPATLPPADKDSNLARSEAALHSNGDMSNSHYDMNMVFIDGLFRHLLWTGDVAFAKEAWPVIERHLAWERRLFRREFGPDKLPLYEAYANIWASDDLQYNGGGAATATAYNLYHNRMAARVARLVGADPAPYEKEAALIDRGMRANLWMEKDGAFAEAKDLLGDQLVHPSFALWSFYHTVDSGVPTPQEAWRMVDAVDRNFPDIPVKGPGVPSDRAYHVLPTTTWMPYSWSINNVTMNENLHTALAMYQAGRSEEAFTLTKGSLLASMFMGISPGNVGTMNYLDVYRRESQRDFGDGSGVTSRMIVEGLFGLRPDALAGTLEIRPGWPAAWDRAKLTHPDVTIAFTRQGETDRYAVSKAAAPFRTLKLRLPARRDRVASVTVNGVAAKWTTDENAVGAPALVVETTLKPTTTIAVTWAGDAIVPPKVTNRGPMTRTSHGDFSWWIPTRPTSLADSIVTDEDVAFPIRASRHDTVDLSAAFNDRVTEIFKPGKYVSPRSPFVSLALPSQGIGAWAGHVNEMAEIDDKGLRQAAAANGGKYQLPNGVLFAIPTAAEAKNIVFTSKWDNYPDEVTIPVTGKARQAHLLMAGSTNHMQSRLTNGEVVARYTDGTTATLTLRNPETWWPIEQDYFVDDYQFQLNGALPTRVDLKTGQARVLDPKTFKGTGRTIPGGAATVLTLPLDPAKTLQSLTVRAVATEVVIGLMAVTLDRP